MRLLCDNPRAKNPQQMVELNGPSSSMENVWQGSTDTSQQHCHSQRLLCAALPPLLSTCRDIQLLLLNQMGEKGRVMVAQKRKVQLKQSEKIAIKSI